MFLFLASIFEAALMLLEPAYRTYKYLRTTETTSQDEEYQDDEEESRELFTHWVVYAAVRMVDCALCSWMPLFGLTKIAGIVWLRAGGIQKCYQAFVGPFLDDNQLVIDDWLERYDQVKNSMVNTTTALTSAATDMAAGAVAGVTVPAPQSPPRTPVSSSPPRTPEEGVHVT
ncbi:TB2/DP1/HVA22-related protein [Cinara cedri]|uniref:TB2/DP1/HVA22-related protein n=1 Tax=Cinara cedri TaxID=506608 RepID=A0A5E4N4M9_9HEMI|nr:TB2/DP1/HVA22-related protein [Cinara cedri]